jgi:hypothetical protein
LLWVDIYWEAESRACSDPLFVVELSNDIRLVSHGGIQSNKVEEQMME